MKDRLLLLAMGIVCAAMSWAYFHFAGRDAIQILGLLSFCVVFIDNLKLRRKLRDCEAAAKSDRGAPTGDEVRED